MEESTFTYSIKSNGDEMLVIRTDDKQKLLDLRREMKAAFVKGQKTERPKMNVGDNCPNCEGTLEEKSARNKRTQQPYTFLGCSEFPSCTFTAYPRN